MSLKLPHIESSSQIDFGVPPYLRGMKMSLNITSSFYDCCTTATVPTTPQAVSPSDCTIVYRTGPPAQQRCGPWPTPRGEVEQWIEVDPIVDSTWTLVINRYKYRMLANQPQDGNFKNQKGETNTYL